MTLPKKNSPIRCQAFGVGFDNEHEQCQQCVSAASCFKETHVEATRIIFGEQPKFPLAVIEKKTPEAELSRPYITDDKVVITMRFDLNWLKRQLGLDWKKLIEDEKDEHDEENGSRRRDEEDKPH